MYLVAMTKPKESTENLCTGILGEAEQREKRPMFSRGSKMIIFQLSLGNMSSFILPLSFTVCVGSEAGRYCTGMIY